MDGLDPSISKTLGKVEKGLEFVFRSPPPSSPQTDRSQILLEHVFAEDRVNEVIAPGSVRRKAPGGSPRGGQLMRQPSPREGGLVAVPL